MIHLLASSRLIGVSGKEILSPFLFIIAMEGLNTILKTTNLYGWIKGFKIAQAEYDSLKVTHLQYADDILIFLMLIETN